MKPIIKYRGGKLKEIQSFEKHIPKNYDTYIEPFFGGGAVFFHFEPKKAIINDINEKLIRFYNQVKSDYATVRTQLDALEKIYTENQREYEEKKLLMGPEIRVENKNEELYYNIRNLFNYPNEDLYLNAVTYFFINKTAYSGMVRYNRKGEYNVPFGRYKNFNTQLLTKDHNKLLKNTDIYNGDFSEIFKLAKSTDFMFLDPPYDTIFNDYGNIEFENGFDETHHRRLAEEYKKLKCKALMIIGATDLTRELYKDFIVEEYEKKYAVNIRNRFKSTASHLVVMNYEVNSIVIDDKCREVATAIVG